MEFACVGRRPYLETDDDGLRGAGEHDIVFGDLSHSFVDDVDLHLLGREFDEGVGQSLDRAVGITFDDDVELMELTQGEAVGEFVETQRLGGAQALFSLQLQALVGDVAGLLLSGHHMECVAGGGGAVETEDDSRL